MNKVTIGIGTGIRNFKSTATVVDNELVISTPKEPSFEWMADLAVNCATHGAIIINTYNGVVRVKNYEEFLEYQRESIMTSYPSRD